MKIDTCAYNTIDIIPFDDVPDSNIDDCFFTKEQSITAKILWETQNAEYLEKEKIRNKKREQKQKDKSKNLNSQDTISISMNGKPNPGISYQEPLPMKKEAKKEDTSKHFLNLLKKK